MSINLNNFLTCYSLSNYNKIRLGNPKGDGDYVIYDLENNYDCLLGCGIGNDSSFELDFYNKYKTVPGFLFDSTIENIPDNFPKKYHFIKKIFLL